MEYYTLSEKSLYTEVTFNKYGKKLIKKRHNERKLLPKENPYDRVSCVDILNDLFPELKSFKNDACYKIQRVMGLHPGREGNNKEV